MSSLLNNTDTTQEAISAIHEAGGHLVLCRARDEVVAGKIKKAKSPIWSGWQKQRPALDVSIQHDGPLGIIPYSIGTSALDLDRGDWRKMPRSWVNYGTRRKGGRHLFYGDDQARGNSNWSAEDCGGEVRGANGYMLLWKDGANRLADAISGPRQMSLFPFPHELIQKFEPGR